MADIAGLRGYLRADEDDEVIEAYLAAAREYAHNAGIPERRNSRLYDLLVYMLACHWYDNRGVQVIGSGVESLSKSVDALVLQLRNLPEEEPSDD